VTVNNSNNFNKTKESINSAGQQLHQHQQNKRKFKQCWSTIPPTSTKGTIIPDLNTLKIKKT
jgi:hypothetical protein